MLFGNISFSDYLNIYVKEIDGSFKLVVNIFNFSKNEHVISNTANLFDGKWHHFIWSIDSSGIWNICVNGIEESIITSKAINISASYNIKYIGRSRFDDLDNTLALSMADFRIYNRVLTNSEVIELYNANNYTEYDITYYDEASTISDAIIIGGGGGGNNNGGGGAGKIAIIENANIFAGTFKIRVGRGGAGKYTTQNSSSGNNSVFNTLIADGGGSVGDNNGIGGSGSGDGGTNTTNDTSDMTLFNTDSIYFWEIMDMLQMVVVVVLVQKDM